MTQITTHCCPLDFKGTNFQKVYKASKRRNHKIKENLKDCNVLSVVLAKTMFQ